MKEFLFSYWKELAYLFIGLITLIICIFRKKGKVDPIAEYIFPVIPNIVRIIEEKVGSGNGSIKKQLVMELIAKHYKDLTGLDLIEGSCMFKSFDKYVEDVLSTPQKKGVKND